MSTILVIAAVESNNFITIAEIDSGEFTVTSLHANPLDARHFFVEVDVRDQTLLLQSGSDIGDEVTIINLAVESIGW